MVNLFDYIKYYPNILESDWCDYVIKEIKANNQFFQLNNWERHGIDCENDLKHLYESIINCFIEAKDLYLEEVDINQNSYQDVVHATTAEKNLAEAARRYHKGDMSYFVEWGEKCRIQHYKQGGYMPTHTDNTVSQFPQKDHMRGYRLREPIPKKEYPNKTGLYYGSKSVTSILSLVLYLNDDYEGGNFHINNKEYITKKGSVMVFPSAFMYPHGVKEVTKGERWSISIFMR